MPNLEELDLCHIADKYREKFNFKKLKNLKIFKNDIEDFEFIKIPSLEKLVFTFKFSNLEIFHQLIKSNTLKKLEFEDFGIEYNDLIQIKDKNYSIKELEIKRDCITAEYLSSLINIFPNLINFKIFVNDIIHFELKMKDGPESKINLESNSKYIKIFLEPLENLEIMNLNFLFRFGDLNYEKDNLFFLKENKGTIFESLITFVCDLHEISIIELKNLYYNIDNMPNLKYFRFETYCEEITEENLNKFIIKLLSKDLDFTSLRIKKTGKGSGSYSLEELKKKFGFTLHRSKIVSIYNIFENC